MKAILIPILITTAWAGWLFFPIHSSLKKSKDLIAKNVPFEQHPNSPSMKILVLGDSTAAGVGSADPTLSTAGRIGTHYPTADIQNISRSGMRLEELNQKIKEVPTETAYDLIVLQIGANDAVYLTSENDIRSSITSILNEAEKRGAKIILLSSGNIGASPTFKFPLSALMSKRSRDVRSIYLEETSSRQNISYIDLYKDKKDDVFGTNPALYYAPDMFHPSSDGYGVWFEEIEKKLP